MLPNGTRTTATRCGHVRLSAEVVLRDVLLVPHLQCNLISVGCLIRDASCFVIFNDNCCVIQDCATKMEIGRGDACNRIFLFRPSSTAAVTQVDPILLHKRLGHPSTQVLSSLIPSPSSNKIKLLQSCEICFQSKQVRSSFPISSNKDTSVFDLIHCDLWGPYTPCLAIGAHFCLTIVDDHSRAVWAYLIIDKSEVPSCLKHFFAMIQTQFHKIIKIVRSDNGTEFVNRELRTYYASLGVLVQTSCVGTPQ